MYRLAKLPGHVIADRKSLKKLIYQFIVVSVIVLGLNKTDKIPPAKEKGSGANFQEDIGFCSFCWITRANLQLRYQCLGLFTDQRNGLGCGGLRTMVVVMALVLIWGTQWYVYSSQWPGHLFIQFVSRVLVELKTISLDVLALEDFKCIQSSIDIWSMNPSEIARVSGRPLTHEAPI